MYFTKKYGYICFLSLKYSINATINIVQMNIKNHIIITTFFKTPNALISSKIKGGVNCINPIIKSKSNLSIFLKLLLSLNKQNNKEL